MKKFFFLVFLVFGFLSYSQLPWNSSVVYTAGDQVVHGGRLFEALWWTQNQEPDPNYQYGPWVEIQETEDGVYPIWTFSGRFFANDYVVYNGNVYRAKWETRGSNPESSGGPWEFVEEYTPDNTVPIKLEFFKVDCIDGLVVAKWRTISEKDNDYFSVLSSFDGLNWKTEVSVLPKEASGDGYRDYSISFSGYKNLTYYRLMQTDTDGQFEVFDGDVVFNCSMEENGDVFGTFPNPSLENEKFFVVGLVGEFKVFDSFGRIILNSKNKILTLPKGEYFLVSGDKITRHIVK